MQLFGTTLISLLAVTGPEPITVEALQERLNAALPNDEPMVLVVGKNFEAPPGRVIFMTYGEGKARMVALARAGKDEVSVMFLPRWNAWITESTDRWRDAVQTDKSFGKAAIAAGLAVRFGHTHNELTDDKPANEAERVRRRLMFSTPSGLDLEEFCGWTELGSNADMRGFVAGVLGVMEYWTDARPCIPESVPPHIVAIAKQNLDDAARLFKTKAAESSPEALASLAEAHRGIFWFRFELMP